MALCRAACLRPFVSLRDFRVAVCRTSARRPPCRPLAAAAAAPPPLPGAAGPAGAAARATSGATPAPAPKYATLTAEQQAQVDAYLDILLDWNTRMNLTGEAARVPAAAPAQPAQAARGGGRVCSRGMQQGGLGATTYSSSLQLEWNASAHPMPVLQPCGTELRRTSGT